jgi:hypothetical protein
MPHSLQAPPPRNSARITSKVTLPLSHDLTPGHPRGGKRPVPCQSAALFAGAVTLGLRTGTAAPSWAIACTAIAVIAWITGETIREWLRRAPEQLRASAASRRAHDARDADPSYEKIARELSANLTAAIDKGDKKTAEIISNGLVLLSQKAIADQQ